MIDARAAVQSDVATRLGQARVLPVLTVTDVEQAEATCRALLAGGISCVEITFRTAVAAAAIARVSGIDGLLVGAGTVISVDQAQAALVAGARFAVAPGLASPLWQPATSSNCRSSRAWRRRRRSIWRAVSAAEC
jgi:2-dehydro-3-deoxyphosphogluconate aldolase/(4S)-4-hydroxy-2-oxoglutarate aldolase